MKKIERNTLFYGDNLLVMRDHIPDESVDLIYLDPPFNATLAARSHHLLQRDPAQGAQPERGLPHDEIGPFHTCTFT